MTRPTRPSPEAVGPPRRSRERHSEATPRPARPLDGRLAVPALTAWAFLALLLGAGPCGMGVGALVAATVAAAAWLGRCHGRGRAAVMVAAGAVVTATVLTAGAAQDALRQAGGIPDLARERATVTVVGRVASDPRVLRAGPERRVDRVLVELSVEEVVGRGRRTPVATPVLALAPAAWADLHWHERIAATGRLAPAEAGDDVVALLTANGDPEVLDGAGPLAAAAEHVRAALRESVSGLPEDPRGLLPGLVIGDTSLAPERMTEDMRATGLTHLSAVSGSNVAIVLTAALGLTRMLGLRRRTRPLVAGAMLVAFVVLARPEPSVLRAAVMGGVGLVGLSRSRRGAGLPALAAAVVVLLVADPWLSRSYGFALSTLATLGLLVFARPWGDRLAGVLPERARGLGEAVAIPVAAQVMCAPVVVLLQGSVTLIGVAANLAAAPLVAPATVLGVAAALAAAVWVPLGALLAWVAALPAWGIASIAHRAAQAPYGAVPWPRSGVGALALAALTAATLACGPWFAAQVVRRPLASLGAAALGAACLGPLPGAPWPSAGWVFAMCDVGQGDGLVLRTGADRAVVVDTGPGPTAITRCLDRLQVATIDAVVLTHLHADHVGGLEGVLGRPVREAFLPPVDDPPADWRRTSAALARAGVPLTRISAGDVLRWGEVVARVRWPRGRIAAGSVPNNNSAVLDVRAGGLRLLLLADIEREAGALVREEIAREPDEGPVDVLKVAHHGSANLDRDLLAAVHPRACLISVGAGNDFGHPAPSLLSALAAVGCPTYRTDRDGDLLVTAVGVSSPGGTGAGGGGPPPGSSVGPAIARSRTRRPRGRAPDARTGVAVEAESGGLGTPLGARVGSPAAGSDSTGRVGRQAPGDMVRYLDIEIIRRRSRT